MTTRERLQQLLRELQQDGWGPLLDISSGRLYSPKTTPDGVRRLLGQYSDALRRAMLDEQQGAA